MAETRFDPFTTAYLEAALWSSVDFDGDPLDSRYTADQIDHDTLVKMADDCRRFQEENAADIGTRHEQAGHDFWLTRNGHGAGFWDGDWPEPQASRLTEAARRYGGYHLDADDEQGQVYGMPD